VWKEPWISVAWLSYSLKHIGRTHNLTLYSRGFFKLVEALLQIHSCSFPHSMKQRVLRGHAPQIFRESSHLRFERRHPEENSVARLTSNILDSLIFWPPKNFGLSTPLCHCIAASPVKDVWGQQLYVEKHINHRNLKWTFEDSLPCYCYPTKSNSRTTRSQVS